MTLRYRCSALSTELSSHMVKCEFVIYPMIVNMYEYKYLKIMCELRIKMGSNPAKPEFVFRLLYSTD